MGPSLYTLTLSKSNAGTKSVGGTCNSVQERCIYGSYCTASKDTCTGTCHPTCLKCNGPNANNCLECSPLSSRGKLGPQSGSCGGCNFFIFLLNFFKYYSQ